MWPSGNTRQLSELSCGTASTRSGRGFSCASNKTSPALKSRIAWATLVPVLRTGFAARLSGSTFSKDVSVFGVELSEAGLGCAEMEVWFDGAHAKSSPTTSKPTTLMNRGDRHPTTLTRFLEEGDE